MIAIITEKPSVGMDIARVVGADSKQDGYMSGNGYLVTWALGHLVSLALPGQYGVTKPAASDLPIIPDPFKLVVRQRKTAKGSVTDKAAAKQLEVIDEVFNLAQSIIVATDAGREGELIFRNIYTYLGYKKPFKRLWISSLTDEAIVKGLEDLKEGSGYDGLYMAADCRAKADWLIGLNASMSLAISSGMGNNSLGRVQTPTLALICKRFRENRNFIPVKYWQLNVTLEKEGSYRHFRYIKDIKEKEKAEKLYSLVKTHSNAKITKVEKKIKYQTQPLLYDLTALQKDCNIRLDLSAEATLEIVQSLYEKKLVSYPRTASRHIPKDVSKLIPSLLQQILRVNRFAHFSNQIDTLNPAKNPVNDKKITDHHALIITRNEPAELPFLELKVYQMIAGRMLEAFGPPCEKETLMMETSLGELVFRSHSQKVLSPGWRNVFNHPEDKEEHEKESDEANAEFEEGENVKVAGPSLAQKKTVPKPLYTEASLLTAMETCGNDIENEASRKAMKDRGLGTPATRAAIISTLFKREYITRMGKSLVPTEKGLVIYNAVKDMRIADAEMTGGWEKMLHDIENREMQPDTFMQSIIIYTGQVTREILSFELHQPSYCTVGCPKCKDGKITIRAKLAKCDNEKCGLMVFRKCLNKELTDRQIQQLLSTGETGLIKGFKGKTNKTFDAKLIFDREYNITFSFHERKENKKTRSKPTSGKI